MPKAKPAFLDFIHHIVNHEIDEVSRHLADNPAFANMSSDVGTTRQHASTFFFSDIAHYRYAGDTALHMEAAARIKMGKVSRCWRRRRVSEFAPCSTNNQRSPKIFTKPLYPWAFTTKNAWESPPMLGFVFKRNQRLAFLGRAHKTQIPRT